MLYIFSSIFSAYQFYDFHPDVGLIIAGGLFPASKKVEISTDYGQTKTSLPDLPYGSDDLSSACLVIVNTTTIFVAGGSGELSAHNWFYSKSLCTNIKCIYFIYQKCK